jgi:class 3 adenylate cyclase/tetratricopeptide (TPR) repeat protein
LEGERKTVTALFADIKGSTELERELDPEEARAIIDPALKLMIDAVRRYDGYIVQSTGDGVFALFGAPVAHEDHPQRALHAAARMQHENRRYADQLRAAGQAPLQIRVGVNTGEVVVRSISTGEGKTEYTPIGHTANLASRIQTLANPNSTVIADGTRKLVEGYFTLKALGASPVKGIADAVPIFEVTGTGPLRTRLQRAAVRGYTKFVGRQREMETMEHAAELATSGHGQIVAAVAEAGVGKSRLFYEFKARNQTGWMMLDTFSVSHGKANAYQPVIELLSGYFKFNDDDDDRSRREKVAGRLAILDPSLEDTRPYIFALLGIVEEGDQYRRWEQTFDQLDVRKLQQKDSLQQMDPHVKRRRTLDAVKHILIRESLNQPLMVIFEDLHWIDDETQAFLNLMADSIGTARILLLVTYRPEYSHQWGSKTYYTQLRLDPLGKESVDQMLTSLLGSGAALDPLKRLIIERTEGNPLFIEEIFQSLIEDSSLARNGSVKLTRPIEQLRLPPTVQGILASRIDRLPLDEKDLLQTLSVIGKDFPLALAREVANRTDDELNQMLNRLQLAEFIYEQPAVGDIEYTFKHALTRDVAYNSVLMERRRLLHGRVGAAIEKLWAVRVEDRYSDLTHHYRLAGNSLKAIEYLRLAGLQAASLGAAGKAADNYRAALALVALLSDIGERERREFALQVALGSALTARSWADPEKEHAMERARELGARVGDSAELFGVLWHLAEHNISVGKLDVASALAAQCLEVAGRLGDVSLLLGAHLVIGDTSFWRGDLNDSRSHLARATELYDIERNHDLILLYGIDPWTLAATMLVLSESVLGAADQARELSEKVVTHAGRVGHPYSLGYALSVVGWAHQLMSDIDRAHDLAAASITICEPNEYTEVLSFARWVEGWVVAQRGDRAEGIAQMTVDTPALGRAGQTWQRSVLAYQQAILGRIDEALDGLAEVRAWADKSNERFFDAETQRLWGEVVLMQQPPRHEAAEQLFREAIEMARRRAAKLFQLRATVSLARLLRNTNRRDEARAMLADIYNWFTEGFDTADLKDAKALLDELGE